MKKFLLSLTLAAASVFSSSAETFEVTFTNKNAGWPKTSSYTDVHTSTDEFGGSQWSYKGMSNNSQGWDYVRVGAKSQKDGADAYIYSTSPIEYAVDAVSVNVVNFIRGAINNVTLFIADDNKFTNPKSVVFTGNLTAAGELIANVDNPEPNKYYKINFNYTNNISKNGVFDMDKITFSYTVGEAPALAAPAITSELVDKVSKVTITAEEGAEVYYTIDGTVPTEESAHYQAPFDVYQSCTVKAIAAKNGEYSNVASYNVEMPLFLDGFSALYAPDGLAFVGETAEINCPMTVIWQGGDKNQYLYVQDAGKHNMLVYYVNENNPFNNGDTFNTLQATVGEYGKTTQLTNPVFGEITAGTAVEPIEAELSQVAENTTYSYFKISGLTISGVSGMDATVSDAAGNSVALRNQFKITEGFENAENCTITGFVSVFNGKVQLQPVLIEIGAEVVAAPVISPADDANVANRTPIVITAEEGAEIFCKTSESDEFVLYTDGLAVNGQPGSTFTVEAYAEKNGVRSDIVSATYTIVKADPELAWVNADDEPVTEFTWVIGETTIDDTPKMNGYFTTPEVSSSNSEVATADITSNPWLTVVGPGTTVITLSVAESDEYTAGSADLTLTVVDPSDLPVTADATFDFSDFSSLSFSTTEPLSEPEGGKDIRIENYTLDSNGVVLSFTTTNNQNGVKIFNSTSSKAPGTTLRVYKGSTLTLTAPAGYYVTNIAFTEPASTSWGLNLAEGQPGTFESKEWAADADDKASAVTFEVPSDGTNTYIKAISVSCAKILSGVADIEAADDNAPVEYFNLQGIRVENPADGLYIRRQGSKITKVIL